MQTYKTVSDFIAAHPDREPELTLLREAILATGLKEEVKWGIPTYTLNKKNVVGMGTFKTYVGLWFHQGAFLKDEKKKLLNAQEGKTKGLRQWHIADEAEKKAELDTIRANLEEAIINQEHGKEIKVDRGKPVVIPDELKAALESNQEANKLFKVLTLGKKREFAEYIAEAKREDTKQKRMEKIIPMMLNGIGLNDKYKK